MFMTYLFLVGLAHALEFRRESDRRAVDSAQLEMRLVEAQLQALQRQLHPHFLFNTLNAIAGLMRSDVDAADRMMDRLGDLLRMTLNTSNIQEVSLKEELEVLQKYLDIEQVRLGDRMTVNIDIDPDALDAQLPNFLLQPLVENAVRHGIAPRVQPGQVEISASRRGEPAGDRHLQQRRGCAAASAHAPQSRRWPRQHTRTPRASLSERSQPGVFQRRPRFPGHGQHSLCRRSLAERFDQSGCRMTKIRTLVVDDEPIARARVVSLLKQEDDIEVVGECANGQQAMSAIESTSPDLLFLDIQMPEVNGLDLARTIQSTGNPAVVFVTAYDEYALRAFEVHALDFLLKPFSAERFRSALGHAREQVSQRRKGSDATEGATCRIGEARVRID